MTEFEIEFSDGFFKIIIKINSIEIKKKMKRIIKKYAWNSTLDGITHKWRGSSNKYIKKDVVEFIFQKFLHWGIRYMQNDCIRRITMAILWYKSLNPVYRWMLADKWRTFAFKRSINDGPFWDSKTDWDEKEKNPFVDPIVVLLV